MNESPQHPSEEEIEVTVRLKPEAMIVLDRLRKEFGLRNSCEVASRLLEELLLHKES